MTTIEYNPPETYADNSRLLMEQAREELAAGDLLQASEKAWGAAAAAVKCVAEMRGWQHYAHMLVNAAAWRISREHRRPRLLELMPVANNLHQNYYEYYLGPDEVAMGVRQVEELLAILEAVKTERPQPFTPDNRRDRQRIGMLDGVLDLRGRPIAPAGG